MSLPDENDKAIGVINRQEILTALIIGVFGIVGAGAIALIVVALQNPELGSKITVEGSIDFGRFLDKIVESYDAFLVLLGVGIGTTGTVGAVKLGKSLAKQ